MTSHRPIALRIKAACRTAAGPAVTRVLVEIEAAEPLTDGDRAILVEIISRSLDVAGAALLLRGHRGLIAKDVRAIGPFREAPPPPKPDR